MQGLHRLARTDRALLWGTAALIAFTLGAVAVARTDGDAVVSADDGPLCYNSAGVGAACLPPPPADFEDAAIPTTPAAAPSPAVSGPAPRSTPKAPATSKPPASTKAAATPAAWAPGVAYRTGTQVSYQSGVYACLQPHTSQVDWSPVAAPALWSRMS